MEKKGKPSKFYLGLTTEELLDVKKGIELGSLTKDTNMCFVERNKITAKKIAKKLKEIKMKGSVLECKLGSTQMSHSSWFAQKNSKIDLAFFDMCNTPDDSSSQWIHENQSVFKAGAQISFTYNLPERGRKDVGNPSLWFSYQNKCTVLPSIQNMIYNPNCICKIKKEQDWRNTFRLISKKQKDKDKYDNYVKTKCRMEIIADLICGIFDEWEIEFTHILPYRDTTSPMAFIKIVLKKKKKNVEKSFIGQILEKRNKKRKNKKTSKNKKIKKMNANIPFSVALQEYYDRIKSPGRKADIRRKWNTAKTIGTKANVTQLAKEFVSLKY